MGTGGWIKSGERGRPWPGGASHPWGPWDHDSGLLPLSDPPAGGLGPRIRADRQRGPSVRQDRRSLRWPAWVWITRAMVARSSGGRDRIRPPHLCTGAAGSGQGIPSTAGPRWPPAQGGPAGPCAGGGQPLPRSLRRAPPSGLSHLRPSHGPCRHANPLRPAG